MKSEEIHIDEIDWLISVYNNSFDEELKKESYDKLIALGLSDREIKEKYESSQSEEVDEKHFEKAWKIQLDRNEHEEYTVFEKFKIFFFSPYRLFKNFDSGLTELRDLNYKTKFRQRLVLLISGILFWTLLSIGAYKYFQYKWLQKVENADISDWEENRIKSN